MRFARAFLIFILLVALGVVGRQLYLSQLPKRIGVIYLDGVVDAEKAKELISLLDEAVGRKDIAGIVLRINSPGGAVAPSQELYRYILDHRREKKMYASIGTLGASGAYYVASACSRIYADGGSLVGSIGVIFTTSDIEELLKKIGIKPIVIKSGKFKDVGSPFREMTPEERQYLQNLVDEIHMQFVRDVARARGIPEEKLLAIADGRVFTGEKAKELGLVDGIAPMWQVVNILSKDLGYKKPLSYIELKKKKGFWENLRAQTLSFIKELKTELLQGGVQ